jgi:hypothetical protein
MLLAINCGDDTDCTAATVGATMGILGGRAVIPEDWQAHIGDDIVTISVARGGAGNGVPKTCTELSERVIKQAPAMLLTNGGSAELISGEDQIPENVYEEFLNNKAYKAVLDTVKPNSVTFESTFITAILSYDGDPEIAPMGEKKVHITFKNNYRAFDNRLYNLELRWWLPEGFSIEGGRKSLTLTHKNSHQTASCELDVTIKAGESVEAMNRCVLEVVGVGRSVPMYIPVVLLG